MKHFFTSTAAFYAAGDNTAERMAVAWSIITVAAVAIGLAIWYPLRRRRGLAVAAGITVPVLLVALFVFATSSVSGHKTSVRIPGNVTRQQ